MFSFDSQLERRNYEQLKGKSLSPNSLGFLSLKKKTEIMTVFESSRLASIGLDFFSS